MLQLAIWTNQVNPQGIKIGILSPDIFPETSELLIQQLLKYLNILESNQLITLISPVSVMSRKGTDIKQLKHVKECGNLNSPNCYNSYDIVYIFSSSANLPIVKEISNIQTHYPSTLFFCSSHCITYERMTFLLKSKLVLLPDLSHEANPNDKYVSQAMEFSFDRLEQGFIMANLDQTRKIIVEHIVQKYSKPIDEAHSLVNTVVPKSVVEGIDWFHSLQLPRFSYKD
ncbi:hypothetical protein BC833DRAFT_590534 [Globomyces pollinis-pini]|nr:hypothetical protein BC833DRAFT_590534 [Globomyces pollinis-pini]